MAIASVTLNCSVALTAGSNPASFPGGNIVVTKPTLGQAKAEVAAQAQLRVNTNDQENVVLNEFLAGL